MHEKQNQIAMRKIIILKYDSCFHSTLQACLEFLVVCLRVKCILYYFEAFENDCIQLSFLYTSRLIRERA